MELRGIGKARDVNKGRNEESRLREKGKDKKVLSSIEILGREIRCGIFIMVRFILEKHIFSDIFNLPYVFDGYDYSTHRFDPVYQLNNFFMQIYDNFWYIFMSLTTFPMGLTVNELSSGKCFWLISPEICETF